jgi:hypothetical protein
MGHQDLRSIQSQVFNLIKNRSIENIDVLLDNNSQSCSSANRLAIYQEGYRIRLREALEDDFPSSLALWPEDIFEIYFEKFAKEMGSSTYTLNLVGKFWVEFIEKNFDNNSNRSSNISKVLIELSKFEWSLTEVYFKNCNPFINSSLLTLDEESNIQVQMSPGIQLFQTTYPVHEIYINKKLYDPVLSHIIIWTPLHSNDSKEFGSVKFADLTESEYFVWQNLLSTHNLMKTQTWMSELGWDTARQEHLIRTIFEFGTSRNIFCD